MSLYSIYKTTQSTSPTIMRRLPKSCSSTTLRSRVKHVEVFGVLSLTIRSTK